MPALTTSDLASYVELTIREIERAVFRLRAVGIIAELPEKVEFNGILIPVNYPGPLGTGVFTAASGVNALPQTTSTTQGQSIVAAGSETQTQSTTGTDTQNATQINYEQGHTTRNTWNTYDEV
jgi:hypothetical protein